MKKPVITGEYVPVYIPAAGIFPGPDSLCFKAGENYTDWVPNDFTIIKGHDNRWHAFGITHPAPPDFISALSYSDITIHDGEWLLFHAVSGEGTLKDNLKAGTWKDYPKVLYPAQRPGENYNIYAPHVIKVNETYCMVYGPDPMRMAFSEDLYQWKPQGNLFSGHTSVRDPSILISNGSYIMTYVSENTLLSRTSNDLFSWSESVEIFRPDRKGAPESPFIVKYEELYYLFWCIWDGEKGPYDNRTFVYCSDNPFRFSTDCFVTQLEAHAPEIICDELGDWYIFSAEWPCRGVSAALLKWE